MVIEQGRIAEHGTRDELLDAAGRFADMWGLQRAGLHDGAADGQPLASAGPAGSGKRRNDTSDDIVRS